MKKKAQQEAEWAPYTQSESEQGTGEDLGCSPNFAAAGSVVLCKSRALSRSNSLTWEVQSWTGSFLEPFPALRC